MRRISSFSTLFALIVCTAIVPAQVKISQIYGSGGNTGSPWLNDYIEIYNAGAPQDITGWSVQYASAAGTTFAATNLPSVILGTGQYFLVQESNGGTLTLDQAMALPTTPTAGTIAMSGTDFKVALVSSTTALATGVPTYTGNPTLVDFVGAGTANWNDSSANGGVFAAANNAPPPNVHLAIYRVGCGATDTNNSRADWAVGYPSPRNAATAPNLGISAIGASLPHLLEENQTVRLTCTPFRCATNDLGVGTAVSIDLSQIGGAANTPMTDDGLGADEAANDGVYTAMATVAIGTAPATKSLPVLISDGGGNTGGCYIGLVVYVNTAPDNDNCTSAIPIAGALPSGVSVLANFTGAHSEANWINTLPGPFPPQTATVSGNANRRGLWYKVVGTGTMLRADTCQGTIDSQIVVYGGTCDGMIHIVNSDDAGSACGANTASALCEWCSISGATYYVYVCPFTSGAVTTSTTLRITDLLTACSTALPVATCAPTFPSGATVEVEAGYGIATNDGCDSTPNRFTDILTTVGFPGVPIRGNARALGLSKDADWFRFQAATADTITATITPQLPCQVQILSLGAGGACPATILATSPAGNRCLPVSISASATAGNWYAIKILQRPAPTDYQGGVMPGGLSYHYTGVVQLGGPPPNDNCANAANLAFPSVVGGNTNSATNDGIASCDPSGAAGRDLWYKFTLSGTTSVHLDTCGSAVDTTLAVYSGLCGSLSELPGGCSDNANGCPCASPAAALDILNLPAGNYTVRVSTKAVGGAFSLSVKTIVLLNDDCCGAIPVACGSVTNGTTVGSTAETGIPAACNGPQVPAVSQSFGYTAGVWYSVVAPPTGGTLEADTVASALDSKMWIFTGTCGALTCVTANDDIKTSTFQSKCAWRTNPNQQYFILVGPFSTPGAFTLSVNCAPTPANDDCSMPTVLSSAVGGSIAGTTVGATCSEVYTSTSAFPSCAATAPANGGIFDVWYSYTACANANVTFTTCGSFDTLLSVHTACPALASPNNQIAGACNDQGPTGCLPGSSLTLAVTSGTTYLIRVAGAIGSNPEGNFSLVWAADGPVFYQDNDGDGFGNPASAIVACVQPGGYVTNNQDCNDNNAAIKPGAVEVCDGVDNDCDGLIDDLDPSITGQATWYQDLDGDGYGNPAVPQLKCVQPVGYVSNNGDCNDSNAAINPAAVEICDGLDNDCDTLIDDADPSISGQTTWYQDLDGDGYGNPSVPQLSCSQPSGYVANNTDCNDTNAAVNPAAVEVCDGIDNDCDSIIDEVCPPNDHCNAATVIVDGTYMGDNSLAASEITNLACGAVTNDVWYSYTNTKTCTWNVTASLCAIDGGGAAYNAVLHVFNACGGGLIACNDNFCGTNPKVSFSLAGGATALIAVSAVAPGPGGMFTMVVFHGSAAFSQLGPGCSDGGGPGPTLTIDAPPVICSNRVLSITGAAPAASGMLMFSFPGATTGLSGGCPLYLNQGSITLLFFIGTDAFGNWATSLTVPCDPALECATFTVQGIVFPTSPPPFYQVTSGLSVTLGL